MNFIKRVYAQPLGTIRSVLPSTLTRYYDLYLEYLALLKSERVASLETFVLWTTPHHVCFRRDEVYTSEVYLIETAWLNEHVLEELLTSRRRYTVEEIYELGGRHRTSRPYPYSESLETKLDDHFEEVRRDQQTTTRLNIPGYRNSREV